tara:strand:- start:787 stop:966 length:180 start_codon:yes stop_codon:yes gene_type:complete
MPRGYSSIRGKDTTDTEPEDFLLSRCRTYVRQSKPITTRRIEEQKSLLDDINIFFEERG